MYNHQIWDRGTYNNEEPNKLYTIYYYIKKNPLIDERIKCWAREMGKGSEATEEKTKCWQPCTMYYDNGIEKIYFRNGWKKNVEKYCYKGVIKSKQSTTKFTNDISQTWVKKKSREQDIFEIAIPK